MSTYLNKFLTPLNTHLSSVSNGNLIGAPAAYNISGTPLEYSENYKLNRLRIPTGGRKTSLLRTSAAVELNQRFLEQIQLILRMGLENSSLSWTHNHSGTLFPLHPVYLDRTGLILKTVSRNQTR